MKLSTATVVLLITATWSTSAHSTSMRCGPHLIHGGGRHGPTDFEILRKCGEPSERRAKSWIYRISGRKYELRFNGNRILLSIRQL